MTCRECERDGASEQELQEGYDKARELYGDSYADYLNAHDAELIAKGHAPKPWPISLQGNDGD